MSLVDFDYPEVVWPKTPSPTPTAAPELYNKLKPQGEPQVPVAGVPAPLVPKDDDFGDPGDPGNNVEPVIAAEPDTVKSVTGDAVKAERSGWMKEMDQLAKPTQIGKAFEKGLLSAIPTVIAGVNADVQMVKIANTVGLGVDDMAAYRALEPTLRIALSNPDKVARETSRQRILEALPSMRAVDGAKLSPYAARNFVEGAFSDPTFLERMGERAKFRYTPFTDPVLQVAIEMQENIDKRYPLDPGFVGSWAEKIAGTVGSLAAFIAARKAGGQIGLDAFAVYSGQGEAYQRALQAGASPEVAFKAASMGGFLGATDILPVERLVASPKVTRALFALAISAGKQAMVEGGQEAFQTYMGNVLAKVLYRPDQDLSQDVWESAALGAIAGAGADVVTGGFRNEIAAPRQTQPSPFRGPIEGAVPPEPAARSSQKAQEAPPASGGTQAPAVGTTPTGEAPAQTEPPPAFPPPMKVGQITNLKPAERAVEADYLMAHDFRLLEPIKRELEAGTPPADIRAKLDPLLMPVTEYLANRGVTDPEQVRIELEGMVKNVVKRLASAEDVPSAIAPSRDRAVPPAQLERALAGEAGFVYHATNAERLNSIAELGVLDTHEPSDFTDQDMWPDGSIEKRAYFSPSPENSWQFAPEEGQPVIIRTRQTREILKESTGDLYSRKPIAASEIEYLGADQRWHPVANLKPVDTGDTSEARRPDGTGTETQESDAGPGDGSRSDRGGEVAPLDGAPQVPGGGPNAELVAVAERYASEAGIDFKRQGEYVEIDEARATRIAQAYEQMPHAPQDPAVKEAYDDLIRQTMAQYRALEAAGFRFYFFDESNDPYQGNPWNSIRDLRGNRQMAVFASEAGFGSGATDLNVADNPLLAETGIQWPYGSPDGPLKRVLANDLFRAVHDAFGHGHEGSGFRARGEENAWQAHSRLFSGPALGAMTTETRGQNSWLNFGPHGEANRNANRNAKTEDTVFADQKTGLMPPWTWSEGKAPDFSDESASVSPAKGRAVRHAYIHERIRPAAGIKHVEMIDGQNVTEIADNFKKALGLTVQIGRLGQGKGKAEGVFKWAQSVVRVRNAGDLTTLFHEGGHHLHQMMGTDLDNLILKYEVELENIAMHYYGGGGAINPKDKQKLRREGFAHFFQVFVNNPLVADTIAPAFAPEFSRLLDAQQPGLRSALGEVIKAVDTQITAKSSLQLALEHVETGEKPGFIGKMVDAMRGGSLMHEIGTLLNKAYMSIVGGEFALQKTVHELARIAENNYRVLFERGAITEGQLKIAMNKLALRGERDPVKMYWAAKNASLRAAEFLHSGVRKFNDPAGAPVSKGFAEIMASVTGDVRGHLYDEIVHAFDTYLAMRRIRSERQNYKATLAWLRNGKQGNPPIVMRTQDPDSSINEGDTNQAITDLEAQFPQFAQAAQEVYHYLNAMVEYRRDAGDFTGEQAAYMLAFEDYVPVHRVIDENRRLGGMGDSVTGKMNGIKQFKGSGRQIVSPLRSIWQMTHQQLAVSMTNEMKRSLVDVALDVGQGTGALIEKIPNTQMTGTVVNLSEILKAAGHVDISSAGVEVQGTDISDLRELADELMSGDETATIWRPGDINEKGEHIVYVWRNGKREAYKLNDPDWADDLYRTLTDLAPPQRAMLIHILSAPARALRWGVVTEPIYQLANTIRDGFQSMVLAPGTVPFQIVGKGLKNHMFNAEMKRLYNLSATTIAGREIDKLDRRKFGIERGRLQKLGINVQDVPLANGIAAVVRTFYSSEALGRQGFFARAYERALKDGLSPKDALVEAGYAATDYANYGRGGSRMAELRAVIPFLGAAIQGLDKAARAAFGGPAIPATVRKKLTPWLNRTLNLQGTKTSLPLSKEEAESFRYAAKVQSAMLVMGLASMLLDSMYWGDEEYEEFSPYLRGTRWMVKIAPGQWLGIPKPFQYAFYTTLFSYGLDSVFKGDTTAMMKFLESQLYVTMVPYENPGVALGYELAANKDLFSGREIVPPNLAARPWRMQADVYTSELGKQLGKLTGLSPMVIDHTIKSTFATWGRSAMALSNLTDASRPEQGLEDFAFTRYFIKNGSRSTTVKPAFWNLVGRSTGALTGTYDAFRDLMDAGAVGQAQQYIAGASDDERAYAHLNYFQKVEAKKLHPLRNANDMVTVLNSMRKEITASNFKMDNGDGERLVLSPTVQRQLNDRLSALAIRQMRNALIVSGQPGFAQKTVMPTLSIYKEIEAIDGRVARELKNRLGNKVYAFDVVRRLWPQVRTEILLNGEKAQLTPFVSQARAGGRKYFTEGDGQ